MLIDFGRQPVRQRIALRGVQWHQEFSDLRIGVQLGERPAVGGAPLPQQQTRRFDFKDRDMRDSLGARPGTT